MDNRSDEKERTVLPKGYPDHSLEGESVCKAKIRLSEKLFTKLRLCLPKKHNIVTVLFQC